ncbi:MAG: L-tyrosine/L-tryptophan isonitrile synthase family protein [Pseudonocardiales bacterium]|nr:L-tyrosine/L-tryptophan isonitrile synthase family protein [Pseudonocardiales bacterium]
MSDLVSPARPSVAGALAPPITGPGPLESSSQSVLPIAGPSLSISHARSLRSLPLHLMRTSSWTDHWPVRLDGEELELLLDTLRANSAAASARLTEKALAYMAASTGCGAVDRPPQRPHDVVVALHRILTRSRFLKGSRSCFPLETARAQMLPFVESGQPITILTIGFPFKQHDNGLKTAGPWPDLAEVGALLRLKELEGAFTAVYPPGLRVVVLNDGGYSRPRGWAEMRRYRRQLKRYAQLVGLGNSVRFCDQSRFVARVLGPREWNTREKYRRTYKELISMLAGSPRALRSAAIIDQRLAETLPPTLLAGLPLFQEIVSSLVYSVPVPACSGTDARQWACQVLAWPDRFTSPDLPLELAAARREVISCAWQDAANFLAASLADAAVGVAEQFPPHVRLATVASRPGCSGFSYLGGSTLLPWHGTGCLDGRGLLCAEFLVSLDHRGFLPVYCDLIGDEQPLLMVPFARTRYMNRRRQVDPELLATARLRSR